MWNKKRNQKYSEVFRNDVLEQVRNGRSVKDLSESLGVSRALIYQWKSKYEMGQESENHELKALRKRIKDLETDKEILKKALSIFTRK